MTFMRRCERYPSRRFIRMFAGRRVGGLVGRYPIRLRQHSSLLSASKHARGSLDESGARQVAGLGGGGWGQGPRGGFGGGRGSDLIRAPKMFRVLGF